MSDERRDADLAADVLKMSRFLEDFVTSGPIAALNNVPSLEGIPAVIASMVSTGIYVLHKHHRNDKQLLINENTRLHHEINQLKDQIRRLKEGKGRDRP